MKAVHEMTAQELMEEAKRREARRARNLPLTEPSVLALATGGRLGVPATPTPPESRVWRYKGPNLLPASGLRETPEQTRIFKLFRLAGADGATGRAYWLSQPRASKQTPGIPDLYIVFQSRGVALWWETKIEGGEISEDQLTFGRAQRDLRDAGREDGVQPVHDYGIGDMRAAGDWLVQRGWAVYDLEEPTGVRLVRP